MAILPSVLGVIAIAIVWLLPYQGRLSAAYAPSLSPVDLYGRVISDAVIGSAFGSVLAIFQGNSMLERMSAFEVTHAQFRGLVIASLLGWFVIGPIGGVIAFKIHRLTSDRTRVLLVATAGAVCAFMVPLIYASLYLIGVMKP